MTTFIVSKNFSFVNIPYGHTRDLSYCPPFPYSPPMTAIMIGIMVRVVIMAVVIIITPVKIWIWIIIIWIVRGCVIIWFRMGLLAAFRTGYAILRKIDPTNRIGVQKMVFPSFNSSPVNSPISD